MPRKSVYRPYAIFGLGSTVLIAAVVAAGLGKLLLASSDAWPTPLCERLPGVVPSPIVNAMRADP
jgi:hypothetical protein